MSDKAAGQKTRGPEGCDENGPAAALLLGHVSIQICSFVASCRRPILIATPLPQSLTWCTGSSAKTDSRAVAVLKLSRVRFLGTDRWRHTRGNFASAKIAKNRSEQVPPIHLARVYLAYC